MAVTFVTTRVKSLDGVNYTISVYRTEDSFFAYWECSRCGNSPGLPINGYPDRDAILKRCETLIQQHHIELHPAV
jgi:hypothetical protein